MLFYFYSTMCTTKLISIYYGFQIKNLSAMEVNIVRRFLVRSLQAFYKHDSPEMIDQVEPSTIQRPQATNNIPRVSLFNIIWSSFGDSVVSLFCLLFSMILMFAIFLKTFIFFCFVDLKLLLFSASREALTCMA